jgi:hypothetical protein
MSGEECGSEERPCYGDASGHATCDVHAVVEGADRGLLDGIGGGVLAADGELVRDPECRPEGLVDEAPQRVWKPRRQGGVEPCLV